MNLPVSHKENEKEKQLNVVMTKISQSLLMFPLFSFQDFFLSASAHVDFTHTFCVSLQRKQAAN